MVDGSSKSLSESVGTLVNGVTLLAATAPALRNLLQKANCVISFDRCCHLVFENTDLLLKDHGEAFKHLIELYYGSCKRMKDGGFNFVRQVHFKKKLHFKTHALIFQVTSNRSDR